MKVNVGHNFLRPPVYTRAMDPMIIIPKDRKPVRPLRLVLLMGMTMLLFLLILNRYGAAAGTVLAACID